MFDKSSEKSWLTLAALALSIGWLLPNHHYPWTSFHSEAWIGVVLAAVIGVYMATQKGSTVLWSPLAVLTLAILAVPGLQYALGILPFVGDAWIGTLFLSGLLISLLVGNLWQRTHPNQLGDFLFLAIGTAALISVGLQLYQWFGFTHEAAPDQIWVYPLTSNRPYANLGQPNQLSTLLIWGLLAGIWARTRGYLSVPALAVYTALLILGLVLTQSRTAWLAITLLLLAVWHWRRCWDSKAIPWLVSLAFVLFVALSLSIDTIGAALLLDLQPDITSRLGGESVRLALWQMFADAALNSPWVGYGWNQTQAAHLDFGPGYPATHGVSFAQSHNLFIDLVLWVGIPVGVLISVAVLSVLWRRFREVKTAEQGLIWIAIGAVGLHAMVEYPLHYAYFLLPTGLFMGILDATSRDKPLFRTGRGVLAGFSIVAAALLGLTVNDYFRVESNLFALRFEQSGFSKLPPEEAPQVAILTQLRDHLRMARLDEDQDFSKEQIDWMRTVTRSYPSLSNLHKLSVLLALSGEVEEAKLWLRRTCTVVPKGQCEMAQGAWEEKRRKYASLIGIEWPNP